MQSPRQHHQRRPHPPDPISPVPLFLPSTRALIRAEFQIYYTYKRAIIHLCCDGSLRLDSRRLLAPCSVAASRNRDPLVPPEDDRRRLAQLQPRI